MSVARHFVSGGRMSSSSQALVSCLRSQVLGLRSLVTLLVQVQLLVSGSVAGKHIIFTMTSFKQTCVLDIELAPLPSRHFWECARRPAGVCSAWMHTPALNGHRCRPELNPQQEEAQT